MKALVLFLFLFPTLLIAEEPVKDNTEATAKAPPPIREISVIVTKEGYYPKSISVFEGEKVKFFVTSTVEEPGCMIVESHKVFVAANKGKLTESEAVFDKAGEFAFYCPSSKNDGKIVVLKKFVPKREIASEKKAPDVWTPKEY